jgi:hypothetical protein
VGQICDEDMNICMKFSVFSVTVHSDLNYYRCFRIVTLIEQHHISTKTNMSSFLM